MVRSIRIHFRIIRGLLRDVNSITGQTHRGFQKISLWSRNGLFFDVVYKKCWSTHCWLDVRQFLQLQSAIFVYTGFVIFTGCFISFLVPLLQERNTRTEADDTSNLQSTGVDRETDV